MSQHNSFNFDTRSEQFNITIEQQKNTLLHEYITHYDNPFLCTAYQQDSNGHRSNIKLDKNWLEKIIDNPSKLNIDYLAGAEDCGEIAITYPIELASQLRLKELVSYLVSKNHFTPYVETRLLCDAIKRHDIEFVKYFIQLGASVTECNVNRYSPSFKTPSYGSKDEGELMWCPLAYALSINSIEIAKFLLESGASMNDISYQYPTISRSPLNLNACKRTSWQLIEEDIIHPSSSMQAFLSTIKNDDNTFSSNSYFDVKSSLSQFFNLFSRKLQLNDTHNGEGKKIEPASVTFRK